MPGRPTLRRHARTHAVSTPKMLQPQSVMICSTTATAEHSADYSMPRATDLGPYSERHTRLAEREHGGSQAERASPFLRTPSFTSSEPPASQSSVMLKEPPKPVISYTRHSSPELWPGRPASPAACPQSWITHKGRNWATLTLTCSSVPLIGLLGLFRLWFLSLPFSVNSSKMKQSRGPISVVRWGLGPES